MTTRYDQRNTIWRLISFKNRLRFFSTRKTEKIVEYFRSIADSDSSEFEPPSVDDITRSTGLPRHKVLAVIRELNLKLNDTFWEYDTVIEMMTCFICIRIPSSELEQAKKENNKHAEYLNSKSVRFACKLPIIPRVGEEIWLRFVDDNLKFNHGYVYNVVHSIADDHQIVDIHVHPFHKPYRNWIKLKDEYEEDVRRDNYIRMMYRNKDK